MMKRSMMQAAIGLGGGMAFIALVATPAAAMILAKPVTFEARPAIAVAVLQGADLGNARIEAVAAGRKYKAKRTSRRNGEGSRGHESGETPTMEALERRKK